MPDERRQDPRPGRERFFRREARIWVLAVVEFGQRPALARHPADAGGAEGGSDRGQTSDLHPASRYVCDLARRACRCVALVAFARYGRPMNPEQDPQHDPVRWMLDNAPIDDEPETEEERRAVAEVRADRARGIEGIPFEEIKAEFGL